MMCKQLTVPISIIVALAVVLTSGAYAADPDLIGWWKLDEGSGNTVADSSGSGNDGTIHNTASGGLGAGGSAWLIDPERGMVLSFNGNDSGGAYVSTDLPIPAMTLENDFTWAFWAKQDSGQETNNDVILGNRYGASTWIKFTPSFFEFGSNAADYAIDYDNLPADTWVHHAVVKDGMNYTYYRNGVQSGSNSINRTCEELPFCMGGDAANVAELWRGCLSDVRIYSKALSAEEVMAAMEGGGGLWPYASRPVPADGALYLETWVSMSWQPGGYAASHDVYMGENFVDVNDGTGDTFRGNQDLPYFVAGIAGYTYPGGLVAGTTYYWRIDEVNDADPNSPWKGDVWSFTVPSKKAYEPYPADGLEYIATDVKLSWTSGLDAILHTVFFGDSFEAVEAATEGIPSPFTNYTPVGLEMGKTYYWRVDETDSVETHKGDVWSFTTLPDIPISDPDLLGWWKLDEGAGFTAVDSSGHGNHGTISNADDGGLGTGGSAWLIDPDQGVVLSFNGNDSGGAYVSTDLILPAMTLENDFTWTFWARQDSGQETNNDVVLGNRYGSSTWIKFTPTRFEFYNDDGDYLQGINYNPLPSDQWIHHAVVKDGTSLTYYRNGEETLSNTITKTIEANPFSMGGDATNIAELWRGCLSDVRLYTKALTIEEVQKAMRGDPLLAGLPNPAHGSTVFIRDALPLTWSPGENASEHDVYYGTDRDAVDDADTSTADIYRGRQAPSSYSPPEGVEWGGGPYYWRIDEVNNDGTITKGRVWSFTVADFILIDDFEEYDAGEKQIWYAWHDGLGYGALGSDPYFAGNGTGSAVGDENTASYTEETIVHGGRQSMPLAYDNNKQGYANYSEAELTLTDRRDWTQEGVAELSLWFRGYPASTGSFVEGPAGTYTMTGSGADIWDLGTAGDYHDEFHYAYKMLSGAGSITAKVVSVGDTDPWAKAGVMIRETLDAGSAHAFACVTPGYGVASQGRPSTGAASFNYDQTGVAAPYWVKLDRSISGNFTVFHSADGMSFQPVTGAMVENIPMSANVYIGLAVTAHNASATCQAVFSNVTTTGNVTGQWAHQDIGIVSNAPEPLYVAVSNAAGAAAVVFNDDSNAATIDTWTPWTIPLSEFADQGIDPTNVDSLAIGLGTPGNTTSPGGSGKMYFDDIRLTRLSATE
jgi:hypothetical protein